MSSLHLLAFGTFLAVVWGTAGCGDSDGPAPQADAGDDATIGDDASPADDAAVGEDATGGEDGSVGGLECGDETCVGEQRCCVMSAEELSCVADQDPCDGQRVGCHEPHDCDEAEVCCLHVDEGHDTSCVSSGACDGLVVCTTQDDCINDNDECCPDGVCRRIC